MAESTLPVHIGLILDGNRRWAKEQGLPTLEGHKKGAENLRVITKHAFRRGIKYVSAFTFSAENWQRTDKEVGYLMALVVKFVDDYLTELHQEGIKIVILGRRDGLRSKILKAIQKAETTTKDNTKGTLALCFNYGGHEEIVDAIRSIVNNKVEPMEISTESVDAHLYHPEIPALDLVIRSSGEQRLSGYMLWRAAYAELYFSNTYWPAFTEIDLDNAIEWYTSRERRFGS